MQGTGLLLVVCDTADGMLTLHWLVCSCLFVTGVLGSAAASVWATVQQWWWRRHHTEERTMSVHVGFFGVAVEGYT